MAFMMFHYRVQIFPYFFLENDISTVAHAYARKFLILSKENIFEDLTVMILFFGPTLIQSRGRSKMRTRIEWSPPECDIRQVPAVELPHNNPWLVARVTARKHSWQNHF